MPIHVQPITGTVRFYEDGHSYENKDPYIAVATVQFLDEQTCYVSALHGDVTRKMFEELIVGLMKMGVKNAITFRHEKMKIYPATKYLELFKKYEGKLPS